MYQLQVGFNRQVILVSASLMYGALVVLATVSLNWVIVKADIFTWVLIQIQALLFQYDMSIKHIVNSCTRYTVKFQYKPLSILRPFDIKTTYIWSNTACFIVWSTYKDQLTIMTTLYRSGRWSCYWYFTIWVRYLVVISYGLIDERTNSSTK